jgi:hypothetical protein
MVNYKYNVKQSGNFYLIIIGILLIIACILMYSDRSGYYIITMTISFIFLYVYIETYREFINNYNKKL